MRAPLIFRRGDGKSPSCSFCGGRRGEVESMVAGPGVAICSECVALCNEIFAEQRGAPLSPA